MHIAVLSIFNNTLSKEQILLFNQKIESLSADPSIIGFSTCYRHEIYFSALDLEQKKNEILSSCILNGHAYLPSYLYFSHEDCFLHLTEVLAGLDSPILGETHIVSQVKKSYERHTLSCKKESPLHYLFQKAFKLAKAFRFQSASWWGTQSLEKQVVEKIADYAARHDPILLVGSSSINQSLKSKLINAGFQRLFIASRTQKGAFHLGYDALKNIHQFKAVVFATVSPDVLIDQPIASGELQIIIDLSMPKVTDAACLPPHLPYFDLEKITHEINIQQQHLQAITFEEKKKLKTQVERQVSLYYLRQLKKRQLTSR